MPQPKRPNVTSTVPEEQDRLKIVRSIEGKEQAPSSRSQATTWVSWKNLGRRLGQPYDAEQIPYSKLRQMRRDPMIAFGLHYIKTPLVRAQWRIECEDAQIAAFIDYAWRKVHARFMFQRSLALDFGFVPMVKRFELDLPLATYRDPESPDTPKPVWAEGNVPALVWKPFVALPPELADPVFNDSTGELDGMDWRGPEEQGRGGGGGGSGPDIDIYHTLWGTNERDSVFGSLYGYPRIAYSYRYWWSYWFRWQMYDRYFERAAVPPLIVWHPDGVYEDPVTGETVEFSDVAWEAGSRARANGIITAPSQLAEATGLNASAAGQRAWDLKYLEGGHPTIDMDDSFNYLDIMKLRSLWVPEQAFVEGEGGSSSRNVAAQMAEIFINSQANLMAEIDDEINRFIIPQLMFRNFPEFEGTATKVTTGFAQEDIDFLKQIIQLVGQTDPFSLGVDIKSAMERIGIETLSPQEQARQRAELAAQTTAPATVAPQPGVAGVVAEPGTATGFSYVQHPEVIQLSDGDDFIAGLPSSAHFADERSRKLALRLRNLYRTEFRARMNDLADQIEAGEFKINLSELDIDPESLDVLIAAEEEEGVSPGAKAAAAVISRTAAKKIANQIVNAWEWPQEKLSQLAGATANVFQRIFNTAAGEVSDQAGFDKTPDKEVGQRWAFDRAESLVSQTDKSLRDEAKTFIRNALTEGHTEPKDLAKEMRSHFSERPASKSGTVAVTETVGAWNRAALEVARANGVKQVQAIDAQKGPTDKDCEDRDGKLFTIKGAIKEDERERHPNCTLEWRIFQPAVELSLEFSDAMDVYQLGAYDKDSQTVFFSEDSTRPERKRYMKTLGHTLEARAE